MQEKEITKAKKELANLYLLLKITKKEEVKLINLIKYFYREIKDQILKKKRN